MNVCLRAPHGEEPARWAGVSNQRGVVGRDVKDCFVAASLASTADIGIGK
jgi:hypothetical protein